MMLLLIIDLHTQLYQLYCSNEKVRSRKINSLSIGDQQIFNPPEWIRRSLAKVPPKNY